MSVQEIETAISQLPTPELTVLAAWFEQYHADQWDKQIETDALAGWLDALAAQADKPRGVPGAALLAFAGTIPLAHLAEMAQAISQSCEQVNGQDWQ